MLSVVATEIIDDIINVIIDSGINKIATDENIVCFSFSVLAQSGSDQLIKTSCEPVTDS